MKKTLTLSDIECRFAEINAQEPETLTPEEEAQLAQAEAMNDGTTVSLDEFRANLKEYAPSR